jgi:hypothetical protein
VASRRITSASSSPRPRAIPPSPQIHCTHRYTPITRATLAQVLGIDTGASRGFPLTEGESPRAHPIRFSSRYEAGVILEDGSLCSWTANGVQLRPSSAIPRRGLIPSSGGWLTEPVPIGRAANATFLSYASCPPRTASSAEGDWSSG